MRDGTTEYAPMVNFDLSLTAKLPLGIRDKLGSENFNLPISFIYGDNDWV